MAGYYRPDLRVPFGYERQTITLGALRTLMLEHQDPEFVERFIAWLDTCNGLIGYGGGVRFVQPDKDGFAPPGRSFHEKQTYADGRKLASAVDVVRLNPTLGVHLTVRWSDVPIQGGAKAAIHGVHANVDQGAYPEAWHIQPVERDGWQTWVNAGRPGLQLDYPFPGRFSTPPPPPPLPPGPTPPLPAAFLMEMIDMLFLARENVPGTTNLLAFWVGSPFVGRRRLTRPQVNIYLGTNKCFDCGTGRSLAGSASGDSITAVSPDLMDVIMGEPVE